MENIAEILEGVKTMGIGGHIRPDGDCVGSCMALYLYVKTYYPEIQADVYLDNPKPVFGHIDCMDEIKTELDGDKEYDLFVTCDVSAKDRLAIAGPYFDTAKRTACIKKRDMEFYGVDGKDLDGIVSQLRLTAGVEVAMFIYEVETQSFKVSLRSNGNVDVSKIAVYFGGGGHMRAAGCDLQGSVYDVINNVTEQICKQFQEQEV